VSETVKRDQGKEQPREREEQMAKVQSKEQRGARSYLE
jgi:hypothetical protein